MNNVHLHFKFPFAVEYKNKIHNNLNHERLV